MGKHFTIKSYGGKEVAVSGYASVFDLVDSGNDIVAKGAFKSASPGKVKFLWQHDRAKPIGIIKSLIEDDYGLKVEAALNCEISAGKEAVSLVRQGALDGLSVGFCIKSHFYDKEGKRVIKECSLMEISLVTFPANREAKIYGISKSSESASELSGALEGLNYKIWEMNRRKLWNFKR